MQVLKQVAARHAATFALQNRCQLRLLALMTEEFDG
jgi:hypothetical protein